MKTIYKGAVYEKGSPVILAATGERKVVQRKIKEELGCLSRWLYVMADGSRYYGRDILPGKKD